MHMNSMTAGALANGDNAHSALGAACSEGAGDNAEMKHDALFDRFSKRLKAQVGVDVYQSWFGRLKLHSASKSVVRLTVPTTFLKSWINNRYLDLITSIFQAEDPSILKVEIMVRSASRSTRGPVVEERSVGSDVSQTASPRKAGPQTVGQIASTQTQAPSNTRTTQAGPLFGSPLDSRYTYDREGEPCLTNGCRGTVERIVQSGRSTFY